MIDTKFNFEFCAKLEYDFSVSTNSIIFAVAQNNTALGIKIREIPKRRTSKSKTAIETKIHTLRFPFGVIEQDSGNRRNREREREKRIPHNGTQTLAGDSVPSLRLMHGEALVSGSLSMTTSHSLSLSLSLSLSVCEQSPTYTGRPQKQQTGRSVRELSGGVFVNGDRSLIFSRWIDGLISKVPILPQRILHFGLMELTPYRIARPILMFGK